MKIFLSTILCFFAVNFANAQDIITKRNGEEIRGKVTMTSPSELHFIPSGQVDSSVVVLPISQLFMVKYEDGRKDVFESQNNQGFESAGTNYCSQGRADAKRYYTGYKGAGTAALLTTLFVGPVYSLIPTIAMASTPPANKNLDYPSAKQFENKEYYRCYRNEAKRIKSNKVWTNFGIGTGVLVGAVLVVTIVTLSIIY